MNRLALAQMSLQNLGFRVVYLGGEKFSLHHQELRDTFVLTVQELLIFEATLSSMADLDHEI